MNRLNFIKKIALLGFFAQLNPTTTLGQQNPSANLLMGKNNPNLKGTSFLLETNTFEAFMAMAKAAKKEGFIIKVVSGYRSFERQKAIFENKFRRFTKAGDSPTQALDRIIEYSTIPGTSRHHWGTDLDIVDAAVPQPQSLLEAANFEGNGPFCKLKEWLNTHAESFGFYEVYTNNPNRKGFKYEPWHFSYAPVSVGYLKAYRTLKFSKILSQSNLLGSAYFSEQFISKYYNENILDINPALL